MSLSTCVEKGDWIFDARGFSVYTSMDGANYTEAYSEQLPSMNESDANGIANHTLSFTATEAVT